MPRMILYAVSVPEDAQTRSGSRVRANVAEHGTVNDGPAVSDQVSLEPGEFVIAGEYRGDMADVMALEIEELFSSDITSVPYYGADTDRNRVETQYDGYYTLKNINPRPVDPRASGSHHIFDGVVSKEGTSRTHWRSTAVAEGFVENDFGNATTALVGVPAAATKVKWIDRDNKVDDDPATVQSTVTAEYGSVDLYNGRSPPFDRPALVYELPYENEAEVDAKVWDDRGAGSKIDGSNVVRWQRVFDAGHEFKGDVVIENGVLRLTFDESASALSAENYSGGAWSSTSLGTGGTAANWEVFDVDIWHLGMARVEAQVVWEDTSDGSLFYMDMELPRGYSDALWKVPENEEGPVPSGLVTKLAPVADDQDYTATPQQGLERREEARK